MHVHICITRKIDGFLSVQVNFPAGSQVCDMNGQLYDLLQYHFHTPSEHALDNKRFSMEVHLVHKNRETGTYIMSERENSSVFLQAVIHIISPI